MTPRQPARERGHGAKPGRMCRARRRRSTPCQPSPSPVACARPSTRSRQPAAVAGASARSIRSTTGIASVRRSRRERIAAGPASIWRYADLLPVEAPAEPRLAPGFTPLVPAPRLAEELGLGELWLKLDTANPTHSFKDRVVAVAARKAQELGLDDALLLVDRQPRRSRRRARGGGGARGGGVRAGRPRAREARRRRGLRPAALRRRRPLRPLLPPLRRALLRAPVGFRQRQPPLLLRRRLEDARLRDRRAARLADAGRDRDPDRLRSALPQGRPGLRPSSRALGLVAGPAPRALRRPGGGLRAGRDRVPRGSRREVPFAPTSIARSLAIGNSGRR